MKNSHDFFVWYARIDFFGDIGAYSCLCDHYIRSTANNDVVISRVDVDAEVSRTFHYCKNSSTNSSGSSVNDAQISYSTWSTVGKDNYWLRNRAALSAKRTTDVRNWMSDAAQWCISLMTRNKGPSPGTNKLGLTQMKAFSILSEYRFECCHLPCTDMRTVDRRPRYTLNVSVTIGLYRVDSG